MGTSHYRGMFHFSNIIISLTVTEHKDPHECLVQSHILDGSSLAVLTSSIIIAPACPILCCLPPHSSDLCPLWATIAPSPLTLLLLSIPWLLSPLNSSQFAAASASRGDLEQRRKHSWSHRLVPQWPLTIGRSKWPLTIGRSNYLSAKSLESLDGTLSCSE